MKRKHNKLNLGTTEIMVATENLLVAFVSTGATVVHGEGRIIEHVS